MTALERVIARRKLTDHINGVSLSRDKYGNQVGRKRGRIDSAPTIEIREPIYRGVGVPFPSFDRRGTVDQPRHGVSLSLMREYMRKGHSVKCLSDMVKI